MFDKFFHDFVDVLSDGCEVRRDPFDLLFHVGIVEVRLDIFELVVVIGLFEWSTARHDDNLIDLFEIEQPIGDINHDVAHADNRDPPADLESPLAKRR